MYRPFRRFIPLPGAGLPADCGPSPIGYAVS